MVLIFEIIAQPISQSNACTSFYSECSITSLLVPTRPLLLIVRPVPLVFDVLPDRLGLGVAHAHSIKMTWIVIFLDNVAVYKM